MRRACIDIGSNTTRLLVAEVDGEDLAPVHQERVFTAIGQSLDEHGALGAAKLAQVTVAVAAQLASARAHGAVDVRCVATAGVRRASNRGQLLALIAGACDGLSVEVLSASEEARLAFLGATWWLRRCASADGDGAGARDRGAPGKVAVADVGGGSSELVVGDPPGRLAWWRSLALGSADLVGVEPARARARVRDVFAALDPPPVSAVVAVGGTVASVMRIVGERRLQAAEFTHVLELVARTPPRTLAHRFRVDPQRLPLLPGGLLILEHVSELFGAPLIAGGAGLREGLLLEGSLPVER